MSKKEDNTKAPYSVGILSKFEVSTFFNRDDYEVTIPIKYGTDEPLTTIEWVRDFLKELYSVSVKVVKFQKEIIAKDRKIKEQRYANTVQLEKLL